MKGIRKALYDNHTGETVTHRKVIIRIISVPSPNESFSLGKILVVVIHTIISQEPRAD